MGFSLHFCDWNDPILGAAVDYLERTYVSGTAWEMSGIVVVVRSARARRQLLHMLALRAASGRMLLTPPRIVTPGGMVDMLLPDGPPCAGEAASRVAWAHALRQTDGGTLRRILPHLPEQGQIARWLAVASDFASLHDEVSAGPLRFEEVAQRRHEISGYCDAETWNALAAVQNGYLATLSGWGVRDRSSACRAASEEGCCRAPGDVVLVSLPELSGLAVRMLECSGAKVAALVHAPGAEATLFDAYGCINPLAWHDRKIELGGARRVVADQPADQAAEVLASLAEASPDGEYSAADILVAAGDPDHAPLIERTLEMAGIPARSAVGRPLAAAAPAMLLKAAAAWLDRPNVRRFADLVRHHDITEWLRADGVSSAADLPAILDRLHGLCQPAELTDVWPAAVTGERGLPPAYLRTLEDARADLHRLFTGLRGPATSAGGRIAPMALLAEQIAALLKAVYARRDLSRDRQGDADLAAALAQIGGVLQDWLEMPALQTDENACTASEAIRALLDTLAGQSLAGEPRDAAVEVLGWLELQTDPAPVAIVTGLNEGLIPESVRSDCFLPDRLRTQLGLLDNARRYARDAYFLTCLLHSKRYVALISGRRSQDGDALMPSRLLFACDDATLAARAQEFAGAARSGACPLGGRPNGYTLVLPRPPDSNAHLDRPIQVTAFKTYLGCPYRYYLKHVLRLEGQDDRAREMDALRFGSLLHAALAAALTSEAAWSEEAEAVGSALARSLRQEAQRLFGPHQAWPPIIALQVQQAERRLLALARWQAEQVAAGWRCIATELPVSGRLRDDLPSITGKVDRIDWNPAQRSVRIIDYKTGDSAKSPRKEYVVKDAAGNVKWVDLQLPLYHFLLPESQPTDADFADWREVEIELGYLCLHANTEEQKNIWMPANWSTAELTHARACAETTAERIRDGMFWPPSADPHQYVDELTGICLDRCLDRTAYFGKEAA